MSYQGSCHCGQIRFEVEGEFDHGMECNCSHCSRKGYILSFLPTERVKLLTPKEELSTYQFNKHVIEHHFCPKCGCAPLGFGKDPSGVLMAAVNLRCVENFDLNQIDVAEYDGKSM